MGICHSEAIPKKITKITEFDEQIYNFRKRFNTEIIPMKPIEKKLTFEIRIYGIKAKFLDPNHYYFAKIVFATTNNTFILPITSGPAPKFSFDKNFTYETTFEDMEKNFFEIYLFSIPQTQDLTDFNIANELIKMNKFFSKIFIDILTIAIGPEHHDLHLYNIDKKCYFGRMHFNVQCNHIENLGIRLNHFECKFDKIMHNELSTNMKFQPQNQLEIHETPYIDPLKPKIKNKENRTEYSFINQVKNDNNDLHLDNICVSMLELRSANLTISIYDTKLEIGENSEKKEEFKPILKVPSSNSLSINFGKGNILNLKNKYSGIGFVFLNFYRILSQNDNMILKQSSRVFQSIAPIYGSEQDQKISHRSNNQKEFITSNQEILNNFNVLKFQVFENISKTFEELIYHDGGIIGKFTGSINIKPVPLIRQILCGVHTERGLDLNSNYLTIARSPVLNSEISSLPDEVNQIKVLSENLMSKLVNFSSLSQLSEEAKENKKSVSNIMEEISNLLKKSSKESSMFYSYSNDLQIVKSQEIMIRLGIDLLKMIDNLNSEHRNIGFSILESILERGEFDLSSMTIYRNESNNEKIQLKLIVCELFMNFLSKCLKFSLHKLSKRVADETSKNFVELFLSIAYFRIPKFREAFIKTISKVINEKNFDNPLFEKLEDSFDNDAKLDTENKLNTQSIDLNPVIMLVDWETIFYSRVEKLINPEILLEIHDDLNKILDQNDWKERLEKRGVAFFSIIRKLDVYIQRKLVIQRNIVWTHIQGFRTIIQVLTYELQTRDLSKYNKVLLEVLKTFINDHDIMNIFVSTILQKTNALDANSVFTCFNIIDSFFQEYEQKSLISQFGYKINYNLLRKAFDMIMTSDQSLSLSKLIWLYYRNSHLMSIEHMSEIFIILFGSYFFQLFFHWSYHVRNTLYHLILFIVQYRLKNKSFSEDKKQLTKVRIEKLKNREFQGVANTLNLLYPEQLKAKILEIFYEKMRIVEKIKGIVKKEKLDPSTNIKFQGVIDPEIMKNLSEVNGMIAISIQHFEFTEKYFKNWEKENKGKKEAKYPDLNLQPPKDDYVEYNESW